MHYYKIQLNNSSQNNKTILFELDKQISDSRFEAIIFRMIEESIDDRIRDFGDIKPNPPTLNMLWDNVINKLVKKGFKKINITVEKIFEGDTDLFNSYSSPINRKLVSTLLEKGYK